MVLPTSSPVDLNSLLTNIVAFILAAGATVAGALAAWQKVKKAILEDGAPPGGEQHKILSATITETVTLREFTASNREVAERLGQLCSRVEDMIAAMKQERQQTEALCEDTSALRLVIKEANELLRGFQR